MSEKGVFIPVFGRLDVSSVLTSVREMEAMTTKAARGMSEAFNEQLEAVNRAKLMYRELSSAASDAYLQMRASLGELAAAEANINNMRAQNWGRHSAEMIAAEERLQAAIAKTRDASLEASVVSSRKRAARDEQEDQQALLNNQRLVDAAAVAAADRRSAVTRPLNRAAWAGTLGIGATVGYGFEVSSRGQQSINTLRTQQGFSNRDMGQVTQQMYQISQQSGIPLEQIGKMMATVGTGQRFGTDRNYNAAEIGDISRYSAMGSRVSGNVLSPEEFAKAVMTTSHDFGQTDYGRVSGQFATALAGNRHAADLPSALHSIEPRWNQSGLQIPELYAALNQMSQTGQSNDQSAENLRSLVTNISAPNQVASKSLSQFGVNPEDLAGNLKQRGLAGSLDIVRQAIAKKTGPDGQVVIDAMAQNELMKQQQQTVESHMSDAARQFIKNPEIQKSLAGGMSARKAAIKSGAVQTFTDSDMPLIDQWMTQQKQLEGVSRQIKLNQPLVETITGAYSKIFGGVEGGNAALMLSANPALLGQFQSGTQKIAAGGDPQELQKKFNEAMDTNVNQMDKLKNSLRDATAKITDDFMPAMSELVKGLNGIANFLNSHQTTAQVLFDAMASLAGLFLLQKTWVVAKSAWDFLANGLSLLGGALSRTETIQALGNVERNATVLAGAETTAAGEVATMGGSAAAAGAEMKGSGIGAALKTAASNIGMVFSVAALGMLAKQVGDEGYGYLQQKDNKELGLPPDATLQQRMDAFGKTKEGSSSGPLAHIFDGKAHGGVIGFDKGGQVPGQPLMGVPDAGKDTVLGMVNGKPIGLRGGEGILTPETVATLGGPAAVNRLNAMGIHGGSHDRQKHPTFESDENPFADPFKVGVEAYDSFSAGVAKYSPFGKYMKAAGQTLDSLEQAHENAQKEHNRADKRMMHLYEEGFTPEQLAGMDPKVIAAFLKEGGGGGKALAKFYGITLPKRKRGGGKGETDIFGAPIPGGGGGGGGVSLSGFSSPGGSGGGKYAPAVEQWRDKAQSIVQAQADAGMIPQGSVGQWTDTMLGRISIESSGNPNAFNDWDSNAAAGHPSQGILQFIQSSAAASGDNEPDWQSPSNEMTAFIPYALSRGYNPGALATAHNYATGGVVLGSTTGGYTHAQHRSPYGYSQGGVVANDTIVGGSSSQTGDPRYRWGDGFGDTNNSHPQAPGADLGSTYWKFPWQGGKADGSSPSYTGHGPDGWSSPGWGNPQGVGYHFSTGGIVGFDPGGVVGAGGGATTGGAAVPGVDVRPDPSAGPGGGLDNSSLAPPDTGGKPTPGMGAQPNRGPQIVSNPQQQQKYNTSKGDDKSSPHQMPQGGHADLGTPAGTPQGSAAQPDQDRNIQQNPSRKWGQNNQSKGFGVSGGPLGMAEGAAAMGADAMAPGSGAAVQMASQLMNRAIGYGGQLVGIGLEGLMTTFLPNDSALADPSNNIIGKTVLGIAGAHPSPENLAGKSSMQLNPKQDLDQGAMAGKQMPDIHINGDIHNNQPGQMEGLAAAVNKGTMGLGAVGQ